MRTLPNTLGRVAALATFSAYNLRRLLAEARARLLPRGLARFALSLNAGATSTAITIAAVAMNSFSGSISVSITGLPPE